MKKSTHTAEPRGFKRIGLVAKPEKLHTGVGRYVEMLQLELRAAGVDVVRVAPATPPLPIGVHNLLRRAQIDLRAFLSNSPVWAQYPVADIYHLSSQNLASLLLFHRPPGRVVVTVHDIIPYMLRHDRRLCVYRTAADRLFDHLAMQGLRQADWLIADSTYTRRCLTEYLGIASKHVTVVHLGLDHKRFRPRKVPVTLSERYGLPAGRRYLIYVGSEDPRKNVETLVRALARVRGALPDVELIKVGWAHFAGERSRLLALASELGVTGAVHFLDDVPESDLPLLYNLAAVCVLPSLQEGFGFPLLEAQACGTPVIYAAAASLPEIAGGAGLAFNPRSGGVSALADTLSQLLADTGRQHELRAQGRANAARFRWDSSVKQVLDVYAAAVRLGMRPS